MSAARKPRGDSKLDALTPEQHEQLCAWLTVENLTYSAARKLVKERFGITTTLSALSSYFGKVAAPWKYAQAKGEADSFAQLMEGKFDQASIKKARQLAFEAMSGNRPDLKTAKALFKIIGDSAKINIAQEKLEIEQRKVAILEQKAALADQASAIEKDVELTEEEKAQRMRALFRL